MKLYKYQLIIDINEAEKNKDFERYMFLKDKLRKLEYYINIRQ